MKKHVLLTLLACISLSACPQNQETKDTNKTNTHKETHKETPTKAHKTAHKTFFVSPKNGEKVKSPFKVEMGIEGMKVQAAGNIVEGTGHHHLIIDGKGINKDQVVPKDETHMHFGKGQTETELTLKPGKHTLTLQFADGAHRSFGEPMSQTIEIEVN